MLRSLKQWIQAISTVFIGVVIFVGVIAVMYLTIWGVIAFVIVLTIILVKEGIESQEE